MNVLLGLVAVVSVVLLLWALAAVGRSRTLDPANQIVLFIVALVVPVLGALFALWCVKKDFALLARRERRTEWRDPGE